VQVLHEKSVGKCAQLVAARLPEDRRDVEGERELYRLTRRARWGDDDDASCGSRADECVVIRWKIRIADRAKRGVWN
jgi:hypothetical protein